MNSYLVAAYDMDDHHKVSRGNEPCRFLEIHQDIVINILAECPVSNKGHREIANCIDKIGSNCTFPHGYFWRPLRSWWNGGLNFECHCMASKCKRDLTQCIEHTKHWIGWACFFVCVAHIAYLPSAQATHPGYSWITAIRTTNSISKIYLIYHLSIFNMVVFHSKFLHKKKQKILVGKMILSSTGKKNGIFFLVHVELGSTAITCLSIWTINVRESI